MTFDRAAYMRDYEKRRAPRPPRVHGPGRTPREAKRYRRAHRAEIAGYRKKHRDAHPRQIIAIDGEGWTDAKGRHRYVYMAAATKDELVSELRAASPLGLTFDEVAAWLLELPGAKDARIVGFSLGYDKSKWIESLPDRAIHALTHPELRRGLKGPRPVKVNGWRVNMVSTLFTVRSDADDGNGTRSVWDLFKFFQCSFVDALKAWSVGTPAELLRIAAMKEKRGAFKGITRAEERYCQDECRLLATLAEELLAAHVAEGLELRSYYGPGSTAAAILKECNAELENAVTPARMGIVLERAYFGGRFELAFVGPVRQRVFAWDIASAYPYALAQMPCMRKKCGTWKHSKRAADLDRSLRDVGGMVPTVYRYKVSPHPKACTAWGPLPFRTATSDIVFPFASRGGWAWHAELSQARRLHPGVTPIECWTWVRKKTCKCPPPFQARIVDLFCRRLAWGKTSRGIVIKLGLNSMYGKSAQRVGSPRFRCLVRAGMITAYTRGMLLAAIMAARDPWNVLDVATDSVLTTEHLKLPAPVKLGTEAAAKKAGKSPLGAWECKEWDDAGAFFCRPGLRFPIAHDAAPAYTAARGIGTKILHAHRTQILRAWKRAPMATFTLKMNPMFHGAKTSITIAQGEYFRSPLYGRWAVPKKTIGFSPRPKRDAENVGVAGSRLRLRDLLGEAYAESRAAAATVPKLTLSQVRDGGLEVGELGDDASAERAFRDLRDEQPDYFPPSPV